MLHIAAGTCCLRAREHGKNHERIRFAYVAGIVYFVFGLGYLGIVESLEKITLFKANLRGLQRAHLGLYVVFGSALMFLSWTLHARLHNASPIATLGFMREPPALGSSGSRLTRFPLYSKTKVEHAVQLLGRPAVRFEGQVIEPVVRKSTAMLWYVAHAEGWVPRDDLLYLLWPDMPESRARNNLRQLLYQVGDVAWANTLERESNRIRWRIDSDIDRFRSALQAGAARAVVDAYGGPLMAGWPAGTAPEFDAWLDLEREHLHRAWRKACHTESARLRSVGESLAAAELLERVLRQDPLDEATVRGRMEALVEGGRRTEAQRVFRAFADHLSDELDLAPAPDTIRLAETLRAEPTTEALHIDVHDARVDRWLPPLSVATTEFVGRDRELAFLADAITQKDVRFLSLVATGGMGKTRLAVALADRLQNHFEDGAGFASFVDIEEPERMPGVLADALGLRPPAETAVREHLLGALAQREMVLVLDNLEQLTDDLSLIEAIRAHATGVRLVTTSRERLHVADEWVYDVQGLDIPEQHTKPSLSTGPRAGSDRPGETSPASDAVELFLSTARRVTGSLAADDVDREVVGELCRRLLGMPLAIVLAAGWLRVLSPEEILAELDEGLDVLARPAGPEGDRHRSVQAVLDTTWRRLQPAEREAWARLSETGGSFDRPAAQVVSGHGLPLLLALVNKAIVTQSAGRFDLHPLIRSYGRLRAIELGVATEARRSMMEHFLPWFSEIAAGFRGTDQLDALRRATLDMPNVRAAWIAASEEGRPDAIVDIAFDLVAYHEISGRTHEFGALANDTLSSWLRGRDPESLDRQTQRAFVRLLPWADERPGGFHDRLIRSARLAEELEDLEVQAEIRLRLAHLGGSEMRAHAAAAERLFERLGDDHGLARLALAFGWPLILEGFYREGLAMVRRAASVAARLGDTRLELSAMDSMIPVHILRGDLEQAEGMVERIRDANRQLGLASSQADMLGTLQWLEIEKGDYAKAEAYQDAFFAVLERGGGDAASTREFLRAGLRYREGRYDEAERLAVAYLSRRSRADTGGVTTILTLLVLGRTELRGSRLADARRLLGEAAAITKNLSSPRLLLDTAVATAELLWLEGDEDLARRLIAVAEVDPATEIATKVEIEQLRERGLDASEIETSGPRTPGPETSEPDLAADRDWIWRVLDRVYEG